jgi:hypothetical protein
MADLQAKRNSRHPHAHLARNRTVRNIAIGFFVAAFATAAVAGIFGALITKAAPIH